MQHGETWAWGWGLPNTMGWGALNFPILAYAEIAKGPVLLPVAADEL